MVLNATFNNISVISWLSFLLVEETGVPEENHRPVASHSQTLSHNVVSSTPRLSGIQNSQGTDCVGSYKSNYHTITTTTAPIYTSKKLHKWFKPTGIYTCIYFDDKLFYLIDKLLWPVHIFQHVFGILMSRNDFRLTV